jgi:hypothetical protein
MTTMSDRLEKYRKFAVTGVIPVIATAKPRKSAAFLEGGEVTPTLSPGVTGVTPSEAVTEITVGDLKSVTPIRASKTEENRQSGRRVTPVTAVTAKNDDVEHRAGRTEHDAGIPRDWIEGFARLRLDRPPGDVPPAALAMVRRRRRVVPR